MVPLRDQAVLCANSWLYRRRTVGNSATSGSRVSRISLISFSLGFQCSGSRGSSNPGDLTRSATDWVPRERLAARMVNLV